MKRQALLDLKSFRKQVNKLIKKKIENKYNVLFQAIPIKTTHGTT